MRPFSLRSDRTDVRDAILRYSFYLLCKYESTNTDLANAVLRAFTHPESRECFLVWQVYMCVRIPLYMCPRTTIYVSSYYYISVLILLYMCPHTPIYVSSSYYICVLTLFLEPLRTPSPREFFQVWLVYVCVRIPLHMCPHTTIIVSSYYDVCPHTTTYVSSCYDICRAFMHPEFA